MLSKAQKIEKEIIAIRRKIHQDPEISFDEHKNS